MKMVKDKMTKERMLELALAQFTGYHLGNNGYGVGELVSSMGLTEEEWEKIKEDEDISLDDDEIKEINNYFKGGC